METSKIPSWKSGLSKERVSVLGDLKKDVEKMLLRAEKADTASGLGGVNDAMGIDLVCLPTVAPAIQNFLFPQTEAEFEETFQNEYFFLNFSSPQGTGIRSTTFSQGATLDEPVLVRGLGIAMRYQTESFTLTGARVATPPAGNLAPRVYEPVPVGGLIDDTTAEPAVFEWGGPVWRIVMDLLYNTNVLYVLGTRLILVNQPLVNVGFVEAMASMQGFGTGQTNAGPAIREFNDRLAAAGIPFAFSPPTTTAPGASSAPLPPAKADVQRGGPLDRGAYGNCGSFPLTPHMLLPGMNYQIMIQNQGASIWNSDLKNNAVINTDLLPYVPGSAASRPASGASGTAQTAAFSGSVNMGGGKLQFGVSLRGATLMPVDALIHYMTFGMPLLSSYSDQADSYDRIQQLARKCGLSGVAKPLLPNDKRASYHAGALGSIREGGGDLSPAEKIERFRGIWNDKGADGEHHFTSSADMQKLAQAWAP